jgi:hypothetical protein
MSFGQHHVIMHNEAGRNQDKPASSESVQSFWNDAYKNYPRYE